MDGWDSAPWFASGVVFYRCFPSSSSPRAASESLLDRKADGLGLYCLLSVWKSISICIIWYFELGVFFGVLLLFFVSPGNVFICLDSQCKCGRKEANLTDKPHTWWEVLCSPKGQGLIIPLLHCPKDNLMKVRRAATEGFIMAGNSWDAYGRKGSLNRFILSRSKDNVNVIGSVGPKD